MNAKLLLPILIATAAPLSAQYSLEAPLRSTGEKLMAVFEPQRAVLQVSSASIMDGREERGYGVVVSADGHILTKHSVYRDLKEPLVVIDKKRYASVELLGVDTRWDVCLIKVEAKDLKPVEYAPSSDVTLGSWVISNGATSRFKRRALMGVISAQPRRIKPAGGLVMGISIKKEDKKGLVIQSVDTKGGANEAGIQKGDVLLTADGKEVKEVKELVEHLKKNHYTGSKALIGLKRDKEEMEVFVRLMPAHQMKPPPNRNDQMSGQFSIRRSDFPRVVQHSILANKYSIGGPLLDIEGRCVGMTIARANRAESFAIPVEELQEIAERLMTGEQEQLEDVKQADPDAAQTVEEVEEPARLEGKDSSE